MGSQNSKKPMPKGCLSWVRRYCNSEAQYYPSPTPQNYQLWKDTQRKLALPFKNNEKKKRHNSNCYIRHNTFLKQGIKIVLWQELEIPAHWYFRYFTALVHSRSEFRLWEMHLSNSKLERALLHLTHTWLTSAFYYQLPDGQCLPLHLKVQTQWQADIPDITTENCQEVFSSYSETFWPEIRWFN